jgi:hypothetical protein
MEWISIARGKDGVDFNCQREIWSGFQLLEGNMEWISIARGKYEVDFNC